MIVQLFDPTWYLTEPTGFSLFGNILFGSNGHVAWSPELSAGSTVASDDTSTKWDRDLDNGFDTDEVSVDFAADLADGSVDMLVGDSSISFDGSAATSNVGAVEIYARATVDGAVQWGDLTVTFWSGSNAVESTEVGGPQASTANSESGVAEQVLVVRPTSSAGIDRVTVSGAYRMFAYDAPFDPASLFGQILVKPA